SLLHTQIRRDWNGRLTLRHEFSSLLKERISRSISKISHILRRRDPVVASASPLLCQMLDVPWRRLSATFVQWKDRYQTRARFDCDELPPHRANFSISALQWDLLRHMLSRPDDLTRGGPHQRYPLRTALSIDCALGEPEAQFRARQKGLH